MGEAVELHGRRIRDLEVQLVRLGRRVGRLVERVAEVDEAAAQAVTVLAGLG